MLINARADVNVVITDGEYKGYTASMLAAEKSHNEVVNLLKSAGAK